MENLNLDELKARRERDFKEAKRMINFQLRGDNKYYYARQCLIFSLYVKIHGFDTVATKPKILAEGIRFNKYSITLGHEYGYDLKRFNSKEEMFGFVIGYNQAVEQMEAIQNYQRAEGMLPIKL